MMRIEYRCLKKGGKMYYQNNSYPYNYQFQSVYDQSPSYGNMNRNAWNSYIIKRDLYQMQRKISAQEAINITLERLPGKVVDVVLDTEQGILVWEIEILTPQGVKYEVYVNANTGEIVKGALD
jgi:uncharacterized membrane protein YkoI